MADHNRSFHQQSTSATWFISLAILLYVVSFDSVVTVESLILLPKTSFRFPVRLRSPMLHAAGQGMGMAPSSTSKNKKKSKQSKNLRVVGGAGMGMKKNGANDKQRASNNFDASSSLIRLEKRYDELQRESAKQLAKEDVDPRWATDEDEKDMKLFTEYVVAVRGERTNPRSINNGVADWIPIAHLHLSRPYDEHNDSSSKNLSQAAVSYYCRELSFSASLGAKIFSSLPRNELQYSLEPVDSFYKFVYEGVIGKDSPGGNSDSTSGKNSDGATSMTKSRARQVLEVKEGCHTSEIKQAYRRLSFQYHPDRLSVGRNNGSDNGYDGPSKETAIDFGQIKMAYETLSSGIRGQEGISWYESLGGKDRIEFFGPIDLISRAAAEEALESYGVSCGVVGIERDVVQSFVARNLRST